MTVWLKRLLISVVSIVALFLIAITTLVLLVNPNIWKPEIKALASKQGYVLDIKGDIDWQLFPTLALSIGNTELALAPSSDKLAANKPLIVSNNLKASIELKPLLDRKIRIKEISLDSPSITLYTDKNGATNYSTDDATKQEKPPTDSTSESQSESQAIDLAIQNISINNGRFFFENAQTDQTIEAQSLDFQANNVQLDGEKFPFSLSLSLSTSALSKPVKLATKGQLVFNQKQQTAAFSDGDIDITIADSTINTRLDVAVNFKDAINASGNIKAGNINLQKLLASLDQEPIITANPQALTRVGFSSAFSYAGSSDNSSDNSTSIQLKPLTFTLDQTIGNGEISLKIPSTPSPTSINTTLSLDTINIDDYLAPPVEASNQTTKTSPNATDDSPLPLDSLRAFNVTADISIGKAIASGLTISHFSTTILSNEGLWKLPSIRAELYQGNLLGNASLDARKKNNPAKIDFSATIKRIDLLPLLTDLSDIKDIEGKANIDLTANTTASTTQQLVDNLNILASFNSDLLRLQGFNVEQYYCQAAAQLGNAEALPKTWPSSSEISSVTGSLSLAQNIVTINSITARTVNIGVKSTGNLNLTTQKFKFRVPLHLLQAEKSPAGCLISSNFLKQHEIDVVECKGSLDNLDLAEVCAIDSSSIGTLAKQALRYNAEKKIDKKKQEVRQTVKDKLLEELTKDSDNKTNTDKESNEKKDKPSTRDILKDLLRN